MAQRFLTAREVAIQLHVAESTAMQLSEDGIRN